MREKTRISWLATSPDHHPGLEERSSVVGLNFFACMHSMSFNGCLTHLEDWMKEHA